MGEMGEAPFLLKNNLYNTFDIHPLSNILAKIFR